MAIWKVVMIYDGILHDLKYEHMNICVYNIYIYMLSDTTYNRHVFMPVHAMVDHMMYIYIYIYLNINKQYNTYTQYNINEQRFAEKVHE